MMKRFLTECIAGSVMLIAGKIVSEYAETNPALKEIKDKVIKTCDDFTTDSKDVFDSVCKAVMGEKSGEYKISAEKSKF